MATSLNRPRAQRLRIPFGERDGRLFGPSDVPRGLASGCRCPGCGSPLEAKQGSKRRHHFAHVGVIEQVCRESVLHRYAKQVLADATTLALPAWVGTPAMPNPPSASDWEGRLVIGEAVHLPAKTVPVASGRQEVSFGNVRADVVLDDGEGQLLVEVRVTHKVDEIKEERVRGLGLRMLEVDLSGAAGVETAGLADWVLHQAPRHWVWHPAAVTRWQASLDRVNAIIAARVPVYGSGGENMLVRLHGRAAARLRHKASLPRRSGDPGLDVLLGAWVWLEGEGEAELFELVDGELCILRARLATGEERIVRLDGGPGSTSGAKAIADESARSA